MHLSDEFKTFLAAPNHAVIGTLRPDGHPVTVATWYLLDGERILVNMDAGRKRLAWLRDDPRASLTVLAKDSWYTHVSLQGRVVEWRDDEDLADIDRLSRHYNGAPYSIRNRARVSAWIEVERWHGWGEMRRR
jgi:PPOX class probable F420-dependent enzyme